MLQGCCMFTFHFRHIHLRHSNADGTAQVKRERVEAHFDLSCACKCTCHWDLHIRLYRNTVLLGSYTTLGHGAGEFSKWCLHISLQGCDRHAFCEREVILCVVQVHLFESFFVFSKGVWFAFQDSLRLLSQNEGSVGACCRAARLCQALIMWGDYRTRSTSCRWR